MKSKILIFLIAVLIISGCSTTPQSEPQQALEPTKCGVYDPDVSKAVQAENLVQLKGLLATFKKQQACSANDLKQLEREISKMEKTSAKCSVYVPQVSEAVQAEDLKQLKGLLVTLRQQACLKYDLKSLEHEMSEMAAAKAKDLAQRDELDEAEKWLGPEYAPQTLPVTQAVRGEIAEKRQQWQKALQFYNQALDLIKDSTPTPEFTLTEIELKRQVRSLKNKIDKESSIDSKLIDSKLLAIKTRQRPIPVQFYFDQADLTKPEGQESAEQLVNYLKVNYLTPDCRTKITLIGHADQTGKPEYNYKLSEQRAETVREYLFKELEELLESGEISHDDIKIIPRGEDQPFDLYNKEAYSDVPCDIDELNWSVGFVNDEQEAYFDGSCYSDELNRRVEFVISREGSDSGECE